MSGESWYPWGPLSFIHSTGVMECLLRPCALRGPGGRERGRGRGVRWLRACRERSLLGGRVGLLGASPHWEQGHCSVSIQHWVLRIARCAEEGLQPGSSVCAVSARRRGERAPLRSAQSAPSAEVSVPLCGLAPASASVLGSTQLVSGCCGLA